MSIFHLASLLSERRVREMYGRECVLILSVAVVIIIVRTSTAPKDRVIGRVRTEMNIGDRVTWSSVSEADGTQRSVNPGTLGVLHRKSVLQKKDIQGWNNIKVEMKWSKV